MAIRGSGDRGGMSERLRTRQREAGRGRAHRTANSSHLSMQDSHTAPRSWHGTRALKAQVRWSQPMERKVRLYVRRRATRCSASRLASSIERRTGFVRGFLLGPADSELHEPMAAAARKAVVVRGWSLARTVYSSAGFIKRPDPWSDRGASQATQASIVPDPSGKTKRP
ncbi:hypothetical protein GY45DRAFT_576098 [Cubamyces sp. BRFM 1775]|nr:hypothetical protein GY45DRAFT_576098 [Cubamyces sp. BRFM 1775]